MALADEFTAAQTRAQAFTKRPTNEELLELYALYKQGTVGDVQGKRPGMLDLKGRAKYDAWASKKSVGKDDAMKSYVAFVTKLAERYV